MTKSAKTPNKTESKPMTVTALKDEDAPTTMARVMVDPYLRHGIIAADLAKKSVGNLPGNPRFDDFSKVIKSKAKQALAGELTLATELLTAQALSLDAMMTELMRRATMNFGDYPLAADRYARLAFKAQSNSRAALEALAKLHQPREQTVRHVHVNQGGQAVVTDNFHHHTGGKENEKSTKQPHATGTAGNSAALPSQDPDRNGVPIPSGKGETPMPNARRPTKRRANGKS